MDSNSAVVAEAEPTNGCRRICFAISALVVVGIALSSGIILWTRAGQYGNLPAIRSAPTEWDDMPITSMHIRTSHNSYLDNLQYATMVGTEILVESLERGARCLELDVDWRDDKPVVAHGTRETLATTYSPLSEMLDTVATRAFKQVNDPLILIFEFIDPEHEQLSVTVAGQLEQRFSLMRSDTPLSAIPLRELRNQTLVLSNSRHPSMHDIRPYVTLVNMGAEDPNNQHTQSRLTLNRVFPSGVWSVFGVNMNAIPFMERGFGLVGMNFGIQDSNLFIYLLVFGDHCMMPMVPS